MEQRDVDLARGQTFQKMHAEPFNKPKRNARPKARVSGTVRMRPIVGVRPIVMFPTGASREAITSLRAV